ncbi:hypothetical protein [Thiomicrorhabdus lithotrophica]|uniref:Entry exclusion lipoprotein TrbK n=1 Tax=Thiomicrorhabdus lithotrophica TaxID=2949997 RepID=A0ABY8C741_9GAMM|nr:hypothetical protein [Thiomicrorhabdus lithotrophica]WEJ61778.1 hypothetical protein NR989_07095 [Thiomicrorhabdus lithotrophica]
MQFSLSKTHTKTFNTTMLVAFAITSSLLLSGCEKSAVDVCIEKQSHLWDNKTNDKNANKAYWDAVAKCREQN